MAITGEMYAHACSLYNNNVLVSYDGNVNS